VSRPAATSVQLEEFVRVARLGTVASSLALAVAVGAASGADLTELFNGASPAVVYVSAIDATEQERVGTGFIVAPDGTIVTSAYLVEGAAKVAVMLPSGRWLREISVAARDPDRDVAVLVAPGEPLPAIPLGDSDRIQTGEEVVAIGNPQGLQNALTRGIVNGRRRLAGHTFIQTDAALSLGSTGGPILNTRGEAIGMVVRARPESPSANLAVPINDVKATLERVADARARAAEAEAARRRPAEAAARADTARETKAGEQGGAAERDRLWVVGANAFHDRFYPTARTILGRFVEQFPDDPRVADAWLLIGKARVAEGDFTRALEAFRKALDRAAPPGRRDEARFWEAEALFRLERFEEARAAFDAVVRADPPSPLAPDALYGRAWSELELKRPEVAVASFRSLTERWAQSPLVPEAAFTLARTLVDLERYPEAIPVLVAFGKDHPAHRQKADALYLLGWAYLASGRSAEGIRTLRSFVASYPEHELAAPARQHLAEASRQLAEARKSEPVLPEVGEKDRADIEAPRSAPPRSGEQPPPVRPTPSPPVSPPVEAGEFRFGPYLQTVQRKVYEKWTPASPPAASQALVVVEISRSGQVGRVAIETSSGDAAFDQSAAGAVTAAAPYPPFPAESVNPAVRVRIGFNAIPSGSRDRDARPARSLWIESAQAVPATRSSGGVPRPGARAVLGMGPGGGWASVPDF
jgi:TonB family protein